MIRVIFVLRHDALTKPGGDTSKVQRYVEHLQHYGVDASVSTSADGLANSGAQICHLVNLDLPRTNTRVAAAAKRLDMKVVLSTVSHPQEGLTAMYHHSADRYFKALRAARFSAERGLSSREWLRLAIAERTVAGSPFEKLTRAQQELVDLVDGLLPMAPGENNELARRFKFRRARLVANGLNFPISQHESDGRIFRIVAVGRVEPRKNMLELAEAARQHDIPLIVAGAINRKHKKYVSRFLRVIESSPNIHYYGRLEKPELRRLLSSSSHYANLSWCEVVSQADMEAASLGCKLVLTQYSYSHEFLQSPIDLHSPEQLFHHGSDGRTKFADAVNAAVAAAPTQKYSWQGAGEQLADLYRELLV